MTLEEINELAESYTYTNGTYGYKAGVKYAQSKLYSEDEVLKLFDTLM